MLVGPVVGTGTNIDFAKFGRCHPGLADDVRRYDSQLVVYYDSAVARYGIARMTARGIQFIALWQDDAGNPRPMDQRLIATLRSWDLWKGQASPGTADQEADARDQADDSRRQGALDKFEDDIGHLTRSNRRQLMKAAAKCFNIP